MAMTSTERQRRYRQTRDTADDGEGQHRLNTWISSKAAIALRRLAAHQSATQRTIIEWRPIRQSLIRYAQTMKDLTNIFKDRYAAKT